MAVGSTNEVVIYGGGVAGGVLAKQLSRDVQVTLVDPLDYFEVPMAVPRHLVTSTLIQSAIVPFAEALPRVKHIRARLVELSPEGGLVEDSAGQRRLVPSAITVLATGSHFTNPLVRASQGSATEREAFYRRFRDTLAATQRILIVGGGPIGVEVAGEISETWPSKSVTLVESGPRLLAGTSAAVAAQAESVLTARGVSIITGERVEGVNASDVFAGGGETKTSSGRHIAYDLALWCIGGRPNTAYMKPHFAQVLNAEQRIKVTLDLQVVGQEKIFAMGDITDLAENKMALHTHAHVKVVEGNVRAALNGKASPLRYKPRTGSPMMMVTLGSRQGVAHLPLFGAVSWPWFLRKAKAEHMLVPRYTKTFSTP